MEMDEFLRFLKTKVPLPPEGRMKYPKQLSPEMSRWWNDGYEKMENVKKLNHTRFYNWWTIEDKHG